MSAITVDDLSSIEDYEQSRSEHRRRAIALRKLRRVQVSDRVALVFENRETLVNEIHETMRMEGITDRDTLQGECDVYASLLPSTSELSATVQIRTSPNGAAHAELKQLSGIVEHLSLTIGEEPVAAQAEPGAVTTPVMHVRFVLDEAQRARFLDPGVPASIRLTHPNSQGEVEMILETRQTVVEDLQ